jgi:HK97 family phage portal protein
MAFLDFFRRRAEIAPPVAHVAAEEAAPGQQRTESGPLTWQDLALLLAGPPTRSGVHVNERNALTYVAVYAAAKILAEAVGMLPIVIYEGDEDGEEHRLALEHPLRKLLRYQPNSEQTAIAWKESLQVHLALWGNAYSRIETNYRGLPTALRPLDPWDVIPERVAGELRYRIEKTKENFDASEILHIPALGFDGIKGLSPIAQLRQNIGLSIAAESYGANFFGNGSNMAGFVSYPGKLTAEQRKAARESFTMQTAGLNNAQKWFVTDGDAKLTRIGIPPEDAQFLETRKFGVIDICRAYRIPPHMMGDLEKASYASIEQQGLEFLTYTLMPWLTKWEQEIKRKLIGYDADYFARFDVRQLLRGDMDAQQKFFASGIQWGYLLPNDARAALNKPPLPGGDRRLVPANMQTVNPDGSIDAPPNPAAAPPTAQAAATPAASPARAEEIALPVLEDVITRMYRVAAVARSRNEGPEKAERFQRRHDAMFRAALEPAARALCQANEQPFDARAAAALDEFVLLHPPEGDITAQIPALAAADARALIAAIVRPSK